MIYRTIDIKKAPDPAFVLAYYGADVKVGYRRADQISYLEHCDLSEEDLIELHIFDEDVEFRAVKCYTEDNFEWQILLLSDDSVMEQLRRVEEELEVFCESDHILDEYMDFFGEKWISGAEGSTVLEDQKRKRRIYLTITREEVEKGLSLGVRNYLTYDVHDRMMIYNYRLTGIFSGKQKESGYPDHFSIRDIRTGRGELLKLM